MINCILIDDEPFARETLEEYVHRVPNLNLLGSFEDPLEALDFIDSDVDLIFSDIQMPEMDGLSFLRTLENPPEIIFISGYPNHAIEGYELSAVDFIQKPYSFERFLKALGKVKDKIKASRSLSSDKNHITIQEGHKIFIVQYSDIQYISGLEDYVKIITADETYISKQTMTSLETILPDNFMRIQKSYIVNINFVKSISATTVTLKEKAGQLPIGLKYRDQFYQKLGIQK